MTYFKLDSK